MHCYSICKWFILMFLKWQQKSKCKPNILRYISVVVNYLISQTVFVITFHVKSMVSLCPLKALISYRLCHNPGYICLTSFLAWLSMVGVFLLHMQWNELFQLDWQKYANEIIWIKIDVWICNVENCYLFLYVYIFFF